MEYIKFKRQFALVKSEIKHKLPKNFKEIEINEYSLFYDESNEIAIFEQNEYKIIVIGEYYDLRDNDSSLDSIKSINDLYNDFKYKAGRYVVLYIENSDVKIFTDALSLKQVYYSKSENIVCSDINLFLSICNLDNIRINDYAYNFYCNEFKNNGHANAWVGYNTIYSGFNKLPPNFVLSLYDFSITRYWPMSSISSLDTNIAAKLITGYLDNFFLKITKKRKLALAITAGYDSRVLVGASKRYKDSIYYFIDKKPSMSQKDPDIIIGKKIADIIDVKYNIHDHSDGLGAIPFNFIKTYKESTFLSGDRQLPTVYYYYNNFKNLVNICGVGEIGRTRFGNCKFGISGDKLAYKYGYNKSEYASEMCKIWLNKNIEICDLFNLNPYTLFYWEMDLGNWGSVGNAESDISIEELNPYNAHIIFETMLAVKQEDSKLQENRLFDEMIKIYDKNLFGIKINPPKTLAAKIKKKISCNIFLFSLLDHIKFIIKKSCFF
ncbi:TPA: hypothetical protein ACX6RC_003525 [Photobacterium damselae]